MRILILGVSGMLGNTVFRFLSADPKFHVYGTARQQSIKQYFANRLQHKIICGIDIELHDSLAYIFSEIKPDIVINCVGLVKQLSQAEDPILAIPINSLLPHRLALFCKIAGARLIHMSTDCVYSGSEGMYAETDLPDASDLYGRSKFLGEVDYSNAITLRSSIIGHELNGSRSLVNWFLSQENTVHGYTKAFFSGLPTVEIARIIKEFVLLNPEMHGVYHVSAEPISKYDLLQLIRLKYGKDITIIPDGSYSINRSLDSSRFRLETGFNPKPWTQLIAEMYAFK